MNIIIRKAQAKDATGLGSVHVKCWQESYYGIVDEGYLSQRSITESVQKWQNILKDQPKDVFRYVVEADKKIVGFAAAGRQRDNKIPTDGEIYALYLLNDYKGRGLGSSLMQKLFLNLMENGLNSVSLWVFSENKPARNFYEKWGAQAYCEQEIIVGTQPLYETSYIWDNVSLAKS